ncbi:MAG: RusA family crossover junction endodeoxyribonuclease [Mesorhizobium sp.]|uniref:RusA family crossover junction endodeoxyribonuclease n=1 Tax=Mesorhizobium sp. TaxID=1871066 RepID=UPI0012135868|nr:RusA family crossover junction endodeoxyribonuclease [Mesorhizobium sp.]TIO15608.1 MAG: RusA family crossover junction endodeoxyribonuclease [Mesorhizobium sp.]
MIRYELPFPPSLNNLFRNIVGGRTKSEGYKRWISLAQGHILEQGRKRLHGFVSVSVALVKPDKRKRDLDNAGTKAILDLLVSMQVIDDDSLVQRISIQWVESGPACSVIIQHAEEALAA